MKAALAIALLAALLLPQAAQAHAELVATAPERGARLDEVPRAVTLRFNEPVEASFGAVRVFDAGGERVDTGRVARPADAPDRVAARLEPGLPEGTYTVTYRVVSADAHPVAGGFVFSVGDPGATPSVTVAGLIEGGDAGPVTSAAFGVVRALSYLAIALAAGGAVFFLAVWLPSLRAASGAEPAWEDASEAFAARFGRLATWTVALGLASGALGLVLQGANAAGTSFWTALDLAVIADVLSTRFGTVWGLRLIAWLLVGTVVAAAIGRSRLPTLRPASLGASGLALGNLASPGALALVAAPLAFLVVSPALSGHAGATEPRALLLGADAVHVLAMSVWVGGLAALLLALPAATRVLAAPERTRLLAACLRRFSPLALASVVAMLASGVGQSIAHLESLADLTDSAFGRAILVKAALLAVLIGLGAINLRRSRPRLERVAVQGGPPGAAGLLLRRTLRTEALLLVLVLGVSAALTSYPPPGAAAEGPFSASADLGAARLDLTVDPAKAGANEIHVYLFSRRDGRPYDRVKELGVALKLPEKQLGPFEPRIDKAGPGHYVARRALIAPAGDWEAHVSARVSEFEEHRAKLEVPVR